MRLLSPMNCGKKFVVGNIGLSSLKNQTSKFVDWGKGWVVAGCRNSCYMYCLPQSKIKLKKKFVKPHFVYVTLLFVL